jgi:hypothetical protein
MTKDIKQIQEHNRKAIICAVHCTDDYEEALEKEAKIHFLDDSDGPFGYGSMDNNKRRLYLQELS